LGTQIRAGTSAGIVANSSHASNERAIDDCRSTGAGRRSGASAAQVLLPERQK